MYIKIDENNKVIYRHYMPFDNKFGLNLPTSKLEEDGFLVDYCPEDTIVDGVIGIVHFNPNTREYYYEYEDIQPTPEEEQEARITELENLLADLIEVTLLGGAE